MTATLTEGRASAPALPLRPYQREGIDGVRAIWGKGVNRVAVVLATGGGKTVLFAHLIAAETAENGGRTLVLAHREEIVKQAADTIRAVVPDIPVGIEMADRKAGPECRAVVASVQTLASPKRIRRWARDAFTQVIVDECHHSLAKTYIDIMDHFGCFAENGTRTAGFTATLARGDGVGLGSIWRDAINPTSILELIADGYLVNPTGISVPIGLDLGKASVSHGDYTDSSLGSLLKESGFETAIAKVWAEHAGGRPGLAFTPTVATAQSVARAMREEGLKAEAVWGGMDDDARTSAVAGLRHGGLDVAVNCAVLTEGTDIPRAEVALLARPTRSKVLFAQMVGRVLRTYPGKTGALVIDVVGATADNRLCTLLDLAEGQVPEREEKEKPKDGETLTEAVERIAKIKLGKAKDVDLFGASTAVWLKTRAGHWFVPAGDGYVALYTNPSVPGKYAVAMVPPAPGKAFYATGAIEDLTLAMALGEEKAKAADRASGKRYSTASRDAAWRARKPTDKQLALARHLGLEAGPGMRQGEVGDLITVRLASARIDRALGGRPR